MSSNTKAFEEKMKSSVEHLDRELAAVLGIYGDLFARVVKRQCGIKDYGTIFPGHGGILDRFDSVMFIAPVVTMVVIAVFYH